MNKLCNLLILFVLSAIISCDRERVDPIDIFATEGLNDTTSLNLGTDPGLDKLMVNADRIIKTPTGFHIKGTVFGGSLSGIIPLTSGDFNIKTDVQAGSMKKGFSGIDFSGYGTANFPSAGLFSSLDIAEVPGSDVYYNTGKIFKNEALTYNLPLTDDRYYFRYKVDEGGKGREYKMKNITVKLHEFFLDARDPSVMFTGDIYTKTAISAKKLLVEKGVAGLSANELWNFEPYKYSQNLETITGGTGFEKMNGGIYLSGIIPVKSYPVKIFGQAVINTSFSKNGRSDFFERGFDDASFRLGVNGQLFFTNQLVSFLTGVDTVKLGKATLQAEFADNGSTIRMAGEYSDNVLERFLGSTMMKFIPYNAKEGVMYMRGSGNPDDFLIYLEENISLQVPGLGTVPLSGSVLKITKNEVNLSGSVNLPYSIGDVKVTGQLKTDGTFLLKGLANSKVNLGAGLEYNAALDVEVSDKGVKLSGTINLPYGVGNLKVTGGILSDEIYFGGILKSAIPFPVNASVNSDLLVSLSSKTGINLEGSLTLPGNIGDVSVTGTLNSSELLLTGSIGAGVSVNFGNVDIKSRSSMSLTASSITGVIVSGSVSLPFSLANASVTIRVTAGGLSMTGDLSSGVTVSGYPVFNADMSLTASTTSGLYLDGKMKFPGNFGWVSVSGFVRNSGYNLIGDISSASIDFGIVQLSTEFSMSISNSSGIRTTAEGEGCINLVVDKLCTSVDVDIEIDYYNNSVRLCMDFPVVGDACVGW